MKQLGVGTLIIFCAGFFLSCQPSGTVKSSAKAEMEAADSESGAAAETAEAEKIITDPRSSVILRDDARIWMNNNGTISSEYVAKVDMGTEVLYLGEDEKLRTGEEFYMYSRVKLSSGKEGWVSSVRLARNAVSAIVLESCRAYKKPVVTEPLDRIIPAGQIVAVSQQRGIVNGFVEIIFSYYEEGQLSVPERLYIPLDKLTTNTKDLDVARLVLKAFRSPNRMNDFFSLTLAFNSDFKITDNFGKPSAAYQSPDWKSERVSIDPETDVRLLAVNPFNKGHALPWYPAMVGENFLWISSEDVKISPSLSEKNKDGLVLEDHSSYGGSGVPSVNLLPGLALRKMVSDSAGEKSLAPDKALGMGETVYFTGDEFSFRDIPYLHLEFSDGSEGWSSKSYIAVDAKLAVALKGDVAVYTKPDTASIRDIKLQKYQLIALHGGDESGFVRISYISRDDESLHRDVYIQVEKNAYSSLKNDVDSAMLFHHYLNEEKEGQKALYLNEAASIDSFMREELRNRSF